MHILHCLKSHVTAQMYLYAKNLLRFKLGLIRNCMDITITVRQRLLNDLPWYEILVWTICDYVMKPHTWDDALPIRTIALADDLIISLGLKSYLGLKALSGPYFVHHFKFCLEAALLILHYIRRFVSNRKNRSQACWHRF